MEQYLDAGRDLALKQALDRPPVVDRAALIRSMTAGGRTREWLRTYLAAMTGPGKLTADEFYLYALERPQVTVEAARCFVGKTAQHKMHMACNDGRWFAAADDKALFYTILGGADLPIPRTFAHLAPQPRPGLPGKPLDADALVAVTESATGPLFAKPMAGIYSIGSFVIEGAEGEDVVISGHGPSSAAEVADYIATVSPDGYLLQEALVPHPDLAAETDGSVPSLRMLVLLGAEPQVLSAVLKLPADGNVADNFWRSGNRLAAVERDTGRVLRAIVNSGQGRPVEVEPPISAVPDWQACVDLVQQAARAFPGIRTQSWDVALTDRGPVLLDLNFGGDLNLHQLSHDRGILSEEYRDHLRQCGYRGRLS